MAPGFDAFAHDANGSLTSKQTGAGTLTLGWDESNQLKTASTTGTGATSQSYTYDPQGRRISKTIGASTTHYLYDGQDIHAEYAGWSQALALIGHGPGIDAPLAKLPLTNGNFDAARYYHADGQGSIEVVSRAQSGADVVDGVAASDPWGALYLSGGSAPPSAGYAYQGRERDETGLIYYRARYYDPSVLAGAVGRFVSRDPIGYAGGLNPYAAFNNDPINLGDPSGTTAMARGIQGLINQSYYDNVASAFGFTAPSSSSQSLATANYRPSVYAQSSTANLQTALAVASAVPLIGSVASLASAGLAIAEGDAVGAALGVAGAIPGVGSAKAAARGADILLDAVRVERGSLVETASMIRQAGLHPASVNQRTIAVGEDINGQLFAGSSNGFDRGQRAAAEQFGIVCVSCKKGMHAEENLLREVPGLKRVGTSVRTPCGAGDHNCRGQLLDRGVGIENE